MPVPGHRALRALFTGATGGDAARFRALASHAYDLVAEIDQDFRLTYVGDRRPDHAGHDSDSLVGWDARDLVHPDDRDRAIGWLRRALVDRVDGATFRLRQHDGHYRLHEATASTYLSSSGPRVVVVTRDISRRQEEDLQSVLSHLRDAVVIIDEDLRARYLNPAMADLLGYSVDELRRVPIAAVIHPEDFEESISRGRRRAAGDDVPVRNRMRLIHRDGHTITVDVVATPYVRDGAVHGVLSEFRDVGEQVAAQEALAASEERYRQLFELVQDGLLFSDPGGRPLLVNEAFCRLVGYSREEVMERHRLDFVHPEERGEAREWLGLRAGGRHETLRYARRLVHRDGSTVYTETQAASFFQDGEYAGVLSLHTDVTERKRLEEEAVRQRERAQRAALREEFMAIVSHELRTPLTSILGYGELLEMGIGGALNEAQREYLDEIMSAGGHLLQLINDILDMSKIEANRLEIRPSQVDPAEVVQEALQALAPIAAHASVRLQPELRQAPATAHLDPRAFRQIVTNLVSNAVKFSEEGAVAVALRTEGANLVLMVEDTGTGIPPDQLERIFEPFTQVDTGLDRAHGGTGLGLTIAARLVELHGGQIQLCSMPGAGTAVRVTIPLDPDGRGAPAANDFPPGQAGGGS